MTSGLPMVTHWFGCAAVAVAAACLVMTGRPAHAQILDDWIMLHSGPSFDYLVTERGLGALDSAGVLRRVTVSRMLVRYPDEMRTRIVAQRQRVGAPTAGYGSYISSTFILNVDCDSLAVALVETTDFDSDGQPLWRHRVDPVWGRSLEGWDDRVGERLIDWTCTRKLSGDTVARRGSGVYPIGPSRSGSLNSRNWIFAGVPAASSMVTRTRLTERLVKRSSFR